MVDKKDIWHEVLASIKVSVSSASFSTWFSQTHIASLEDAGERYSVQIGCATSYAKNTIEERYFGLVQESLAKSLGKPCDIVFLVRQDPDKTNPFI